ncbi:MAG TPA: type I methionyl aminopeptidase [Chloroflexota bacterium]|nr:type I methionyl aminopeptidase [Chloroflexota bacterium]
MAIPLKTRDEIARLREAGRLVAETYEVLREYLAPGVSTAELDGIAERYIRRRGAKPVYKGYQPEARKGVRPPPFPGTICVAVNEVICHGIPNPKRRLREGDIIGIDIGVLYRGWVGDSCVTFTVGAIDPRSRALIEVTKECLNRGIAQSRAGSHMGDIGAAIQAYAEPRGFSVVSEYVGHGVGRRLHEEPNVPHTGDAGTGIELLPGMVFTIEPMINLGAKDTELLADRWTVVTKDRGRSAQFEHMVAITENGPEVLTLL